MIEIYTDGGNNVRTDRKGTWAFVVVKDDVKLYEKWETLENVTNSVVELKALKNALLYARNLTEKVVIKCDSQYIVKGYNEWCRNWVKNKWQKSSKGEVAHKEIWKVINSVRQSNIKVEWVRGHNGDKWNEYVDKLTHNGRKVEIFEKKPRKTKEDILFEWLHSNYNKLSQDRVKELENIINKWEEHEKVLGY